ncbi:hypothetical protein [Chitinimonas sp.]|uniref:hypothetical protein n=1 Tax=Chitinimonas sp. TaxID=1934313 RepID=UPI0035B4CDA1
MTPNKLLVAFSLAALSLAPYADVVVVVSSKSPIGPLNKDQVTDTFMGKAKNVGGASVSPIDYADSPKEAFYSGVLGKSPGQMKSFWAKLAFTGAGVPPKELGSQAEAKKQLTENPSAITFMERSQVDGSVKVVFPQ